MKSSNKDLITCSFCNHSCLRPDSEFPPLGTPLEIIAFVQGDRRRAMFCTGCKKYTVHAQSSSAVELERERYIKALKKP
jgi:hypothetical protein